MSLENATPTAEPTAAASEQQNAEQLAQATTELQQAETQQEAEAKPEGEAPKKEKTPEEREIARLRRRVDNLTKQKYELLNGGQRQAGLTNQNASGDTTTAQSGDDEPLTLPKAQLQKLIEQEARKLAPTIKQQEAEVEHRRNVVTSLAKELGQEKFDALASDLDDAFGGLADQSGRPKPATDAIFEADNPRALIEYLADPEHADEAEAIARMGAVQAARAITKLELKLESEKAKQKPQPSKVPAPLEPVRGGGQINGMPDPLDTKAWIKWSNEQERRSR